MVTWTTYGMWLQGDKRGYVKNGEFFKKNERLREDNEQRLVKDAVRLGRKEKKVVGVAIRKEAEKYGIGVEALAVCSNHVHAVVGSGEQSIEETVARFKNAGRVALRSVGVEGRVWAKGFNKQFCFDEQGLKARIAYVKQHGESE
jgi:REP element-mobilizing transposase RayT